MTTKRKPSLYLKLRALKIKTILLFQGALKLRQDLKLVRMLLNISRDKVEADENSKASYEFAKYFIAKYPNELLAVKKKTNKYYVYVFAFFLIAAFMRLLIVNAT